MAESPPESPWVVRRGVFLDRSTVDRGDLDLSPLQAVLPQLTLHDYTAPEQVTERLRNAGVVITNKVTLDAAALEAATELRLVCISATGTNNVDRTGARHCRVQCARLCHRVSGGTCVCRHTVLDPPPGGIHRCGSRRALAELEQLRRVGFSDPRASRQGIRSHARQAGRRRASAGRAALPAPERRSMTRLA